VERPKLGEGQLRAFRWLQHALDEFTTRRRNWHHKFRREIEVLAQVGKRGIYFIGEGPLRGGLRPRLRLELAHFPPQETAASEGAV